MRVPEMLSETQVPFETLVHPPAFSAPRLARVLHLSGRQVVKSVLLHGPLGYMVAVLPCDRHLDLDRLASHVGGTVRLASPPEIASVFQDCEWGVVPSFGAMYGLPVLLEATLGTDELLVFEGQSSFLAIRMRCGDFERLEKARRLSLIADLSGGTAREG